MSTASGSTASGPTGSRISRIETFATSGGVRNWIFVRVSTDDGLYGWGEASTEFWDDTVVSAVRTLGAKLLGSDALASEDAWQRLFRHGFWRGGAIGSTAIAAIDQALWDIRGKRWGVPVYRLLGGPTREWIRTYRHVGIYRPDDLAIEGAELAAQGVRVMKTGAWVADSVLEPAEQIRRFAERFAALRDAVGDEVELMIDNHGRSRPGDAVRLVHAVAPYRPRWIEEPVGPEAPELVEPVSRAARDHGIDIALGERLFNRWEATGVLGRQLVDVIQPDLCHAGGITEVIKMASLADTFRCGVAPHNPGGPLSTAAAAHVGMAIPNFDILEFTGGDVRWSEVVTEPWQIEPDRLWVPDRPGLGVEIDLDAVAEVPPARISVPGSAFGPDGAVADI